MEKERKKDQAKFQSHTTATATATVTATATATATATTVRVHSFTMAVSLLNIERGTLYFASILTASNLTVHNTF